MRDHSECEDAMNQALARGQNGLAEFIATRCDLEHGPQQPDTEGDADA